jgi:hypothetical protein
LTNSKSMRRLPSPIPLMQKTKDPKNSLTRRKENIYMCLFLILIEPLDAIKPSISPKKPIDSMQPLKKSLTPWTLINHRSQIQNTNLSLADIKLTSI